MLDEFARMLDESRGADADAAVAAAVDWAQEHDQTLGEMLWWFANPTGQDSYDFAECKFFILGMWLKQTGEPRFKEYKNIMHPRLGGIGRLLYVAGLKRSVLALFPEVKRKLRVGLADLQQGRLLSDNLAALGFRVSPLELWATITASVDDGKPFRLVDLPVVEEWHPDVRFSQTLAAPYWIPLPERYAKFDRVLYRRHEEADYSSGEYGPNPLRGAYRGFLRRPV